MQANGRWGTHHIRTVASKRIGANCGGGFRVLENISEFFARLNLENPWCLQGMHSATGAASP
jgi:hypothetical protein